MTANTLDWVQALGEAMCAQWGLDANQCLGIDVHWRPRELPTATITMALNEGVVQQLLTLTPVDRRTPNSPPIPYIGV